MKRTSILFALILASTLPAFGQSAEFGAIFGGSRRIVRDGPALPGNEQVDDKFSFSNASIDLYWSMPLDVDTNLKFKFGRIESPVAFTFSPEGDSTVVRRDAEGEVQHFSVLVDYRFDEPYGSTGIFAGIGLYRHTASGFEARSDYGFSAGVNADFPMTRRYGVVAEATYHWTHADFDPRYLTLGAGLRVRF